MSTAVLLFWIKIELEECPILSYLLFMFRHFLAFCQFFLSVPVSAFLSRYIFTKIINLICIRKKLLRDNFYHGRWNINEIPGGFNSKTLRKSWNRWIVRFYHRDKKWSQIKSSFVNFVSRYRVVQFWCSLCEVDKRI